MLDENCRQQLQEIEQKEISTYYEMLGTVLSDPSHAQAHIMASICLRNTVDARLEHQQKLFAARWLTCGDTLRQNMHSLVLHLLDSPIPAVRETIISTITAMARAELPHDQWSDLIPQLVAASQNLSVSSNIRQASIAIIGHVCKELSHECAVLCRHTDDILNCIALCMQPTNPDITLRISAVKALCNALKFCSKNFEKENERSTLMHMITTAATPEASINADNYEAQFRLQAAAWDCLTEVSDLYYSCLQGSIETIFNCSLATIQQSLQQYSDILLSEAVQLASIQAIEFWTTLAHNEEHIQQDINAAEESGEPLDTLSENLQYTTKAIQQLLPLLLQCLCLQPEDPEDESYNITLSALTCIQQMARLPDVQIINIVLPRVQSNITHTDWRYRDAAATALGCLLTSPLIETDQSICQTLTDALVSVLLQLVNDSEQHVAISSSWALSQYCEFCPLAIVKNMDLVMQAILHSLSSPRPRPTATICRALYQLSQNLTFDDEESMRAAFAEYHLNVQQHPLSQYFAQLVQAILTITEQCTDATLLINSYEALSELLRSGASDNAEQLTSLLNLLGTRLQQLATMNATNASSYNDYRTRSQGLLCGTLSMLIAKLPPAVVMANITNLLNVLTGVLNTDPSVTTEALCAIEAVIYTVGSDFQPFAEKMMSQLIDLAGQNSESGSTCERCFTVIGTLLSKANFQDQTLLDKYVAGLLNVLNQANADRQAKVAAADAFLDIALVTGIGFSRYYEPVVGALLEALQQSLTKVHEQLDYDLAEYLILLQTSICNALDGIILALCTVENNQSAAQLLSSVVSSIVVGAVASLQDTESSVSSRTAALQLLCDTLRHLRAINPSVCTPLATSPVPNAIRPFSQRGRSEVRKLALQCLQLLNGLQ